MKAHEVIKDPKNWTFHKYARDAEGDVKDPLGPDATCYCALGAIGRAYDIDVSELSSFDFYSQCKPAKKLRDWVRANTIHTYVPDWNDKSTHAKVYKTLKELDI